MKTTRRHELKDNDLAQQLAALGDTLKAHGVTIAIGAAGVLVVVLGVLIYSSAQAAEHREAWDLLASPPVTLENTPSRIGRYKDLADKHVSDLVSARALERSLIQTMESVHMARDIDDEEEVGRWLRAGTQICTRLGTEFGHLDWAWASARLGSGLIAEERGEFDQARELYQEVIDDPKLAKTAYPHQARYRLENLDKWRTPIVFAPPAPPQKITFSPAGSGAAPLEIKTFSPNPLASTPEVGIKTVPADDAAPAEAESSGDTRPLNETPAPPPAVEPADASKGDAPDAAPDDGSSDDE